MKRVTVLLLLYNMIIFSADPKSSNTAKEKEELIEIQKLRDKYFRETGHIIYDCPELNLVLAAKKGDLEKCKRLIKIVSVNILNQAPLKMAVKHGHVECVKLFIERKADLKGRCGYYSPLSIAAKAGNQEIIELLLQAGVHINDGHPVIRAIKGGHVALAEWLIQRGANPTKGIGNPCERPIHHAAAVGSNEAIAMLIKHGNDVNACGIYYQTPLHQAAKHGHRDTMDFLKQLGAKETKDSWGNTPSDLFNKYNQQLI